MEGVASGRSGRTSNRYNGTTTTTVVGPVRKWSKNWVPIVPTSTNHNNNNNNSYSKNHNNNNNSNNTVTHLRLFKWTPLSKQPDTNDITHDSPLNHKRPNINHTDTLTLTPPKKFKFVPIAVLEELNKEEKEKTGDEAKLVDGNEDAKNGNNKKPDINDLPMEDTQDSEENKTAPVRQDLNELDLSLGLTAHEEEHEFNSKTHPNEDGRP